MQSHFPLPSVAVYSPKLAPSCCVKKSSIQTHSGSCGRKLELWVFPTVDVQGLLLVCFRTMHPLSSSVAELGFKPPLVSRQ